MKGLTSYDLKIIAIVTMVIDHIGMFFFPEVDLFRIIGRSSFIIFSFLIVEGFIHSHNVFLYGIKMSSWAILSEVPYDLANHGRFFDLASQNIFFTLLSGIICLYILSRNILPIIKGCVILVILLLANILNFEYGYLGVLQIIIFYILRNYQPYKFISVGLLNFIAMWRFVLQIWAIFGLIPISQYNGQRGKKTGLIFYSLYAGHLLLFWLIKPFFI